MLLAQGLARRVATPRPPLPMSQPGSQPDQVTVVTQSLANSFDDAALPFAVARRPGLLRLAKLIFSSDVVLLAGPAIGPLSLALLLRKPVVVEHHGYQANCPNGLLLFEPTKSPCPGHYMLHHYSECLRCNAGQAGWFTSLRWLMLTAPRRWLCARASVNLCITEHVAQRVQLPHSTVIYYGVPKPPAVAITALAQATAPRHAQGQSRRSLSAAYVGRLVQEKGVETLIRAMGLVREQGYSISLKIIGDGPQRQSLEAMAGNGKDASPAIRFTGSLQGGALHSALQGVAVVVVPSLNEEPAGLVVMEQMMAGRPVIVTDHGGAAEIADGAGLSFPPGDAAALAACLRRLADEPNLLAELAARARSRAADLFTQARMVEDHHRVFEGLVHKALS